LAGSLNASKIIVSDTCEMFRLGDVINMCRSLRSRLFLALLLAILAILQFPAGAHAQQLTKRLILKDGSYQPAVKWEIKGERVHYLSAERNEWEDVPASLVDWDATKKYEEELKAGQVSHTAAEIDKEVEAERKEEEAKTPVVAPGLRLPEDGGVVLFENFQGQPQLSDIQQSGGELNKDTKRNILRATINPLASAKQNIELPGAHARIQSHTAQPTLYISLNQGTDISAEQPQKTASAETPSDPQRFRIVRMQVKGDKRIAGNVKISMVGKVSQQENLVPTNAEVIPGNTWVKLTPKAALSPGEYAVAEMLGDEGMNLYVWDFGVNPNAPANPGAWKPDPRLVQQQADNPSDLQKR
jgi:hypothetical protein